MEKQKTSVHIAGKEFSIASYDSPEYVQRVAAYVDRYMNELHAATKLSGAQLAILTAVNATDDMFKSREEIRHLQKQLDEVNAELAALKENGNQHE